MDASQLIAKNLNYAIVGASNNPEKYGHRVMKDLLESGYQVFPVNLKEKEILGVAVSPTLRDVSAPIDVVVTIVPPHVTEQIVKEANVMGLKHIWMQPGSESDAAIKYCQDNDMVCIHDYCIMVARRNIAK